MTGSKKLLRLPCRVAVASPSAAEIARARRDSYVLANLPLVSVIARTLRKRHHWPPCIDFEDLRGAGYVGLVKAAGRYTRAFNVPFPSYAQHRIKGEMLELVRRKQLHESSGEPLPKQDIGDHHAGDPVEAIDITRRVVSILQRLSPTDRTALMAYYLDGATYRTLSAGMGISLAACSKLVHEALIKARDVAA